MSILETILSGPGEPVVRELADQHHIDREQALAVLARVVPNLSRAVRDNVRDEQGLDGLLGALQKGQHDRYLEEPQRLRDPQTVVDGNGILGHLLGSKDASRSLAGQVAREVGLDDGIVKKILPLAATLVMGALSRQSRSGALGEVGSLLGAGQQGSAMQLVTRFLDRDQDGSVVDDVMAMALRFLR